VTDLRANGKDQLESISFMHRGKSKTIETGLLLVHFGVMPQTHLSRLAGCSHRWDSSQQCFRPEVDIWGNTSVSNILIAGDAAGIGGARTAEHAGRLAALQATRNFGCISKKDRARLARNDKKWMQEERHIRPFLEAFFHIPGKMLRTPDNNTVVCRCEEITAGDIRRAVDQGYTDNNQVKFLTRCGMGPCKGRQCSDSVAHIVAEKTGIPVSKTSLYRTRPPVTPLTLGQLASLYPEEIE
jgi:bacterioferritin-associated ferredoxin